MEDVDDVAETLGHDHLRPVVLDRVDRLRGNVRGSNGAGDAGRCIVRMPAREHPLLGDETRADDGDLHAVRPHLLPQRPGEADDGVLRRCVNGVVRVRRAAGERGHVADVSAPPCHHPRQHQPGEDLEGHDVRVDDPRDVVGVVRLEPPDPLYSRVVDEEVDRAELRLGPLHQPLQVASFRHVRRHRDGTNPPRLHACDGVLQILFASSRESEMNSFRGKGVGHVDADPTRRPGNDPDFVVKVHVCLLSRMLSPRASSAWPADTARRPPPP